jgi:hypothetical protein
MMEGTIQITLSHSDAMVLLRGLAEANRTQTTESAQRTWIAERTIRAAIEKWPQLGDFKMPGIT